MLNSNSNNNDKGDLLNDDASRVILWLRPSYQSNVDQSRGGDEDEDEDEDKDGGDDEDEDDEEGRKRREDEEKEAEEEFIRMLRRLKEIKVPFGLEFDSFSARSIRRILREFRGSLPIVGLQLRFVEISEDDCNDDEEVTVDGRRADDLWWKLFGKSLVDIRLFWCSISFSAFNSLLMNTKGKHL